MNSFNAIRDCFCTGRSAQEEPALGFTQEKKQHPQTTDQSLAADILSTLYAADANDENLVRRLQDIVHETGWYDTLAAAVLAGLEDTLKSEAPMGQAMKDAYEKAAQVVAAVWHFAKDHPVFCAVVALGILVILAPWAIEVLGFGELGPIEGTFAAWWQSRYMGNVPAGSLFSFFQRLGMVWRMKGATYSLNRMEIPAKSYGGMYGSGAIRL